MDWDTTTKWLLSITRDHHALRKQALYKVALCFEKNFSDRKCKRI